MPGAKWTLVLWVVGCVAATAQEFEKIGTTGFTFLEVPVSARVLALGEAGSALSDAGAEGIYCNPSAVAWQDARWELHLAHTSWYVGTTLQGVAVTWGQGKFGTIGFHVRHFDFGKMERTTNPTADQAGSYISLGTYSAGAYAVGLTYARALTDKFSFGGTIKYVRETIDVYSADNVVADLGFLYHTGFHTLRIGASLHNFGLDSKYAEEKFKMPQMLRMGLAVDVLASSARDNYLALMAEAAHPNDASERLHVGLEGGLGGVGVVRAGYKFGYADEGLCLGGGVRQKMYGMRLALDVAWMEHASLNTALLYSVAVEF
ncbi:MAG: PorV/PorQ family protein [candidate division KSB1 bacterium]|nr:PorV/PorQ family protein [candidate division KSB1 bacterium]